MSNINQLSPEQIAKMRTENLMMMGQLEAEFKVTVDEFILLVNELTSVSLKKVLQFSNVYPMIIPTEGSLSKKELRALEMANKLFDIRLTITMSASVLSNIEPSTEEKSNE